MIIPILINNMSMIKIPIMSVLIININTTIITIAIVVMISIPIIMVCIVLISISFTKRIGYFSDAAYSLLVGIIIFFGLVRTLYLIYDIIIRDKTNFDEIDNSYALDIYNSNVKNDNGDDVEETPINCPSNYAMDSLNFGDELDIDASSYNSTYNMLS